MENHKQQPWHSMPLEEVYRDYQTSEDGLSDAEAAKRLKEYGKNELRQSPPKSVGKMFFEQLTDVMVLILLGAALLSGLLNEWIEAIVILTIVIVNAIIGVVQEKKPPMLWLPCAVSVLRRHVCCATGKKALSQPVNSYLETSYIWRTAVLFPPICG